MEASRKQVSVLMPVYGAERFVAAAVRSVLAQTYEAFELLIVDDASPDGSIERCERFDDPRIRILRHGENRGLAAARNTAIRHARGAYLALLDADDAWLPTKLERHVAHLEARPRVGVSFSRSAFIEEGGQPSHYYQMPCLDGIDVKRVLCRNPIGNGSSPMIRREVFEAIRIQHSTSSDWRRVSSK
jgi:glycosyltransferase involved in cell wall biosynthesis